MEKYDLYKVFTPTTPARLTFVEREEVNNRLVNALRLPGKQIVVYGPSGCGKTTLLVNKLHQLYEKHLTSRCMKGLTFESLILDAFDQLSPFYQLERDSTEKNTISASLSQEYLLIKTQIGAERVNETNIKEQRILPPQLTPQALGRFLGEAGCCWVLEDFHKIGKAERSKLSQVMKVFMDMADEYPTLKVVAIGAVDSARQVVEYDLEMKHRVAEINIPLMNDNEIKEIIIKGSKLLNIDLKNDLVLSISSYSNGMASVCHHLCLNICISQNIFETVPNKIDISIDALEDALQIYLDESSDTLKKAFDSAFKRVRTKKYDNARLIIKALSELPQEGASRSDIYELIKTFEPKYPQGNLSAFLLKLCNESETPLIRYDSTSGKYSFTDPIYRVFALVYFKNNNLKTYKEPLSIILAESFKEDFRRLLVESINKKLIINRKFTNLNDK